MVDVGRQNRNDECADLIELVKLSDSLHSRVVSSCARIQPLDNGTDVSEYAGVHQSCQMKIGI